MKISLFGLIVIFAYASAQYQPYPLPPFRITSDFSYESLWHNLGNAAKTGLKDLAKQVSRDVLEKTRDILTDGLRLKPTKEVREALKTKGYSGNVFSYTVAEVLRAATKIADKSEGLEKVTPSHEAIVYEFDNPYTISYAEQFLLPFYNKTLHYNGPSHEGIFGGLGGMVIKGFGNLIGGTAGDVIKKAGDVVGNLFFAAPQQISREGIVQDHEGVLWGVNNFVSQGVGKLGSGLLRGYFGPINNVLGNILLARGNFYKYNNFYAPAQEIILYGRNRISRRKFPGGQHCLETAEKNFTILFNDYRDNGIACYTSVEKTAKRIVAQVQDIAFEALRRVEDSHKETSFCFEKAVESNRIVCLERYIPLYLNRCKRSVSNYGIKLSEYVRQFSDINNEYDVCLVRQLGGIRREIFRIGQDYQKCISTIVPTKLIKPTANTKKLLKKQSAIQF